VLGESLGHGSLERLQAVLFYVCAFLVFGLELSQRDLLNSLGAVSE
jgi:hypothetical protein